MRYTNIQESLKKVEGNLKHEEMFLTEGERELIMERSEGRLTQKEFINKLMELHTKDKKESKDVTYEVQEEKIITPEN